MKLFKNGFTLGEMLICLAIIAVIAAIVIPVTLFKKPPKNRAMFRKAYHNMENVVYELINDENERTGFPATKESKYYRTDPDTGNRVLIQDRDGNNVIDPSTGFAYYVPREWYNDANPHPYKAADEPMIRIAGVNTLRHRTVGNTGRYLCTRIAERMNTSGIVNCNSAQRIPDDGELMRGNGLPANSGSRRPTFVTNDGVAWFISKNHICHPNRLASIGVDNCEDVPNRPDISIGSTLNGIRIDIDVNGNEKPNTSQGPDPDRFHFYVDSEGKMRIDEHQADGTESFESRYLKTNNIFRED